MTKELVKLKKIEDEINEAMESNGVTLEQIKLWRRKIYKIESFGEDYVLKLVLLDTLNNLKDEIKGW